jgi:hypothetical protein
MAGRNWDILGTALCSATLTIGALTTGLLALYSFLFIIVLGPFALILPVVFLLLAAVCAVCAAMTSLRLLRLLSSSERPVARRSGSMTEDDYYAGLSPRRKKHSRQ